MPSHRRVEEDPTAKMARNYFLSTMGDYFSDTGHFRLALQAHRVSIFNQSVLVFLKVTSKCALTV